MTSSLEHLRALVEASPPDALLNVPAAWLRDALASAGPSPAPGPDRLLTAEEVADRMGWSVRSVYRRLARQPFARRLGRSLRFSEAGLTRWLGRQTP